ncbi:MAG TPA: CoA transferase, partial [Gemmatimonadales bacterium]|nr:CoA transferase [Gemmatimonadales bacterium]
MGQALEGLTVLDLTQLLPGPVAGMLLGDFGADVIKVEPPGGDPARAHGATPDAPGPVFRAVNRNKRGLALDLSRPEGRDVLLRLVDRADVLLEGFRPGVLPRLGLGWEVLASRNPHLIYCAITGYGQDGPCAGVAGHDLNYMARSGVLGLNAAKAGPPVIPGIQVADLSAGSLNAVIGVLLALQARERTGRGQMVDIAMLDGVFALMLLPLLRQLQDQVEPLPGADTLSGRYACYRIYETGDGRHAVLGALEPKFWANACQVLGRPDLVGRQFAEGEEQEAMQAEVASIFRAKTAAEWAAAFADRDACFSVVQS